MQKQLDETDISFADAERTMKAITRQIGKAFENEQAVYDEETRHGLNREKQKEWELKVAALLN